MRPRWFFHSYCAGSTAAGGEFLRKAEWPQKGGGERRESAGIKFDLLEQP